MTMAIKDFMESETFKVLMQKRQEERQNTKDSDSENSVSDRM